MAIKTSRYENGTSTEVILGVGTTVAQDSHYLGDGDMSYWGIYFDAEAGQFKTGGWDYYPRGIEIDATPEIAEMYQAYALTNATYRREQAEIAAAEAAARQAEYEAATPRKGKTVEVTSGRKIPKGTIAEVFWYGETQWGYRVGLLIDGEKVFTAAHNVTVIQAEAVAA